MNAVTQTPAAEPDHASRVFALARCLDLVAYLEMQFRGLGMPDMEARAKALHAELWAAMKADWAAMKADAEAGHG